MDIFYNKYDYQDCSGYQSQLLNCNCTRDTAFRAQRPFVYSWFQKKLWDLKLKFQQTLKMYSFGGIDTIRTLESHLGIGHSRLRFGPEKTVVARSISTQHESVPRMQRSSATVTTPWEPRAQDRFYRNSQEPKIIWREKLNVIELHAHRIVITKLYQIQDVPWFLGDSKHQVAIQILISWCHCLSNRSEIRSPSQATLSISSELISEGSEFGTCPRGRPIDKWKLRQRLRR